MKRIIFIDNTCDLTHQAVLDRPIGASEFMFYTTLGKLSKMMPNNTFICFTKISKTSFLDNVRYMPIADIHLFDFDQDDRIIIQRLMPDLSILTRISSKYIFLTQQDYDFNAIFFAFQSDENKQSILPYVIQHKHIRFIVNSEFSQKYIQDQFDHVCKTRLEPERIHVVPNFLFEEYFNKMANVKKNPYQLVYASGWNKGIQHILRVFDYIVQQNPRFQLVLMSPGYEYHQFGQAKQYMEQRYPHHIKILGPTNKDEYCKVIQESACVLAAPFPETFGCVFSEAYYLGTSVIADVSSGAVDEIIGQSNITQYQDLEQTYRKLLEILERKDPVTLNDRYLFDINVWQRVLEI